MTSPIVTRINEMNTRIAQITSGWVAKNYGTPKGLEFLKRAEAIQKGIILDTVDIVDSGITFEKWEATFREYNCNTGFFEFLDIPELYELQKLLLESDMRPYYDEVIVPMVESEEMEVFRIVATQYRDEEAAEHNELVRHGDPDVDRRLP